MGLVNRSTETNSSLIVNHCKGVKMACDFCVFKQYCQDCEMEQSKDLEINVSLPNSKPEVQKVIICGDTLYHNGRPYKIIKIEDGNPNKKYLTAEGRTFFIRIIHDKPVLIKIQTVRKNKKKPDCHEGECNKILIGPIPTDLVSDTNW